MPGGEPLGQAALLGVIFLFVFTAYSTLQGFASQLYGPVLASNVLLTLYAMFTLSCFASPAVCVKLGPRTTAFVGCLCYGALCLASLLLALTRGAAWVRPLCVLAGAVVGVGAALLWTAQGQLLLCWGGAASMGRTFAVFWGIFNLSAVAGGILTFGYFSQHESEAAPVALYAIFCCCVLAGSGGTWLLKRPPSLVADESAVLSWRSEATATLRLFGSVDGALLAPFYFYTGAGQPYQLNTFGNRVFSARLLGLQLVAFYGAEVVAAWGAAQLLDAGPCARRAARRQLALFVASMAAAYSLALPTELRAYRADPPTGVKNLDALGVTDGWRLAAPTAAFVLWGASDAQAQALAYWRIRRVHGGSKEQGASTGPCSMHLLLTNARVQRARLVSTSACNLLAGASALL
jgi:MFS family permease